MSKESAHGTKSRWVPLRKLSLPSFLCDELRVGHHHLRKSPPGLLYAFVHIPEESYPHEQVQWHGFPMKHTCEVRSQAWHTTCNHQTYLSVNKGDSNRVFSNRRQASHAWTARQEPRYPDSSQAYPGDHRALSTVLLIRDQGKHGRKATAQKRSTLCFLNFCVCTHS
jgi:hypothetical protein